MKKALSLLLALIMLLSLCACGASSSDSSAPTESKYANSVSYDSYAASEEAGYATGLAAEDTADNAAGDAAAPETDPDKIIYSAEATVETTDFEDSLQELSDLISKYGGWVESSSVNGSNYYDRSRGHASTRSADYTVRIPSDKFSLLMGSLSEIGNVPYTYTYSENVTAQYYDVQARLTAYTTQETRLLEMMEKAETVSDVITIEDRLTQLRYEIESLQSTLNNWDRQVSYSTVSVSVREVQEYTPESETKISYGRELWLALTGALKDAGSFFKNLLVFIVSALPTLVILTGLFFLLRPAYRKLRARRAERRADKLSGKKKDKEDKSAE